MTLQSDRRHCYPCSLQLVKERNGALALRLFLEVEVVVIQFGLGVSLVRVAESLFDVVAQQPRILEECQRDHQKRRASSLSLH